MSRVIDDGAGGKRNAAEIEARREALRGWLTQGVYNPPLDPAVLSRAALEATQSAAPLPAMRVYGRGGKVEADLKLRGGDSAIEEAADEGGEESHLMESRGGESVDRTDLPGTNRGAATRPNPVQSSRGDSPSAVWCEQVFEADTKEAVMALVPPGSKGVEVRRVWKASALVKQWGIG